ncbi:MAG: efflux RND transporter periplasmic adaptor subunit [Saprospiraceae bacterium]|nr:efflux RND transporter periplasmic adaptor subunit [Saprospiraceae bacterium]
MTATPKPKRRKTLLFVLIGLLVLLIVAAAVKARQKPKGEEVTVEQTQRRTIRETVSASGKIFPETEVKISSDVSGEVIELYVKEGDSVTVGQVLAKIKPDEYQSAVERGEAAVNSAKAQRQISSTNVQGSNAQIEQLRADRNRAAAQLEAGRKSHERNERLFNEGIISSADYETSLSNFRALESGLAAADAMLKSAESNLQSARENVRVAEYGINSAQASLKELRTSLQKTIITAPVSGIVSKLSVEKGERVLGTIQMAGTEIMRIANMQSMEVQVDVSENDILKVAVGDTAEIEVDAYLGEKFTGKVTEIANSASNISSLTSLNTDQVTNFVVKIRIDAASYAGLMKERGRNPFRPGMSASVDIFTHTAGNALTVPLIAVTARDKEEGEKDKKDKPKQDSNLASEEDKSKDEEIKEIVFVVSGDTVGVREVRTGIQDNDYIEILSGLQDGETVVTGPYTAVSRRLKAGTRITVVDKDKDKDKKSGVKVTVD